MHNLKGLLLLKQGKVKECVEKFEEALAMRKQRGDTSGASDPHPPPPNLKRS